ncbi:MAG: TSUP family transporter [Candidatus Omnitrophica bacterium]|nr:TSUP family transporter [Candidatus Omnitrophota bacterium]
MPVLAGLIAFISEYLDSGLGMGYGTALAPVLIMLGYPPLKVIPAILVSQLVTDIAACISHQKLRNVKKLYIGMLVFCMGLLILVTINRPMHFSWRKIMGISFLAAFNKGISGGGYGPLVMGGQMLSGVCAKNAVGITAFAEAVTCLVGFLIYLVLGKSIDWKLTGLLVIFATGAVPIAALTVRNINSDRLKKYVGVFITLLGLLTLLKISSG